MARYSVEPRDQIIMKGYGILSFVKNMSKTLSVKYRQKLLDHAKQYFTDALETTSKRLIQKISRSNQSFERQ